MSKCIDLTGQKFGRLTVIELDHRDSRKKAYWKCKCDCGNEKVVRCDSLQSGSTVSCGCYNIEQVKNSNSTHGRSKDRLYFIWHNMNQRCFNPNVANYRLYGAEGKTVCDEWIGEHGAENFIKWTLGNGYRDDLTIERKDNNKGYSPDNCRWATKKEQQNNTRQNHLLTYNGKTQTIAQWADETGINCNTLYSRINKYHWNIERALTTK